MFLHTEELAIVIWAGGEEAVLRLDDAMAKSKAGEISFRHRRNGVPVYAEPTTQHNQDASMPRHWIKDRGVTGGKYHTPFTPNGHHAQFTLVR